MLRVDSLLQVVFHTLSRMNFIKNIWRWLRSDGLLHIETSALAVIAMTKAASLVAPLWEAKLAASMITLVLGIAKELIWDKAMGKGCAEWHDIYCDLIGIAVGLLL